jgi:hypothetical protein
MNIHQISEFSIGRDENGNPKGNVTKYEIDSASVIKVETIARFNRGKKGQIKSADRIFHIEWFNGPVRQVCRIGEFQAKELVSDLIDSGCWKKTRQESSTQWCCVKNKNYNMANWKLEKVI